MMQSSVSEQGRLTPTEKRRLWICAGAGFFISPGAWLLQVIVSETVSAQTCAATTTPLTSPGVSHMHAWLYATSAVAVLISVACSTLATFGLRFLHAKQKRVKARNKENESVGQPPSELEEISRKRFIAVCSVLIGCGFTIGLVFTILAEVFLVSCSQWH